MHAVRQFNKTENVVQIVNIFLEYGADVNAQDRGVTVLMIGCLYFHETKFEVINQLLAYGADVNLKTNIGDTALIYSGRHYGRDKKTIQILLEHGADVNVQNDEGCSALMEACYHMSSKESIESIGLLISSGANVNFKNKWGHTALWLSYSNSKNDNKEEIIHLLLEHGAEISITSLSYLAKNAFNSPKTIKLLLQHGADINVQDEEGHSALYYLLNKREKDPGALLSIRILLQYGANPNIVDEDDIPLLHVLLHHEEVESVRLALCNGGDYFIDQYYTTPFSIVQGKPKEQELMILLFCHGFNPEITEIEGQSFREHVESNWRKYDHYRRFLNYPTKSDLSSILKDLPLQCHELLYRPDSMRFRVMDCFWNLDKYQEYKQKYSDLMNYLSIVDEEMFRIKISDLAKYI